MSMALSQTHPTPATYSRIRDQSYDGLYMPMKSKQFLGIKLTGLLFAYLVIVLLRLNQ